MKKCIDIQATPEELAELFWEIGSEEQCRFFIRLGEVTEQIGCKSEMQWWYMTDEIKKSGNERAKETLMNMASFFYLHLLGQWEPSS